MSRTCTKDLSIVVTEICSAVDSITFLGFNLQGVILFRVNFQWNNTGGSGISTQVHRSVDGGGSFVQLKANHTNQNLYRDPLDNTAGGNPPFDTALQYKVKPTNCGALFSSVLNVPAFPSGVHLSGFPDSAPYANISSLIGWEGRVGEMVITEDSTLHQIWIRVQYNGGGVYHLRIVLDGDFSFGQVWDGDLNVSFGSHGPTVGPFGLFIWDTVDWGYSQFTGQNFTITL